MEKIKAAVNEYLKEIGIGRDDQPWCNEFLITPTPPVEFRSEQKAHIWGYLWKKEAADVLRNLEGFSEDQDTDHVKYWVKEGKFTLLVRVEMDQNEECARLKARLAELGCHY